MPPRFHLILAAALEERRVFWLWVTVAYLAILYTAVRWGAGTSGPAREPGGFPGSD
jgi:hypothetical protein